MTHQFRHKVLKVLAITLPVAWVTPVVESVILLAHARTSLSCLVIIIFDDSVSSDARRTVLAS